MAFDNRKWAEFDRNYQKSIQRNELESKKMESVDDLLATAPKHVLAPDIGRFIPPDSNIILDPQSA